MVEDGEDWVEMLKRRSRISAVEDMEGIEWNILERRSTGLTVGRQEGEEEKEGTDGNMSKREWDHWCSNVSWSVLYLGGRRYHRFVCLLVTFKGNLSNDADVVWGMVASGT